MTVAENRDIDAELREALARVERGQVVDLGSFAQYADEPTGEHGLYDNGL